MKRGQTICLAGREGSSRGLTCSSGGLTCSSRGLTCSSGGLTCSSRELTCSSGGFTCSSRGLSSGSRGEIRCALMKTLSGQNANSAKTKHSWGGFVRQCRHMAYSGIHGVQCFRLFIRVVRSLCRDSAAPREMLRSAQTHHMVLCGSPPLRKGKSSSFQCHAIHFHVMCLSKCYSPVLGLKTFILQTWASNSPNPQSHWARRTNSTSYHPVVLMLWSPRASTTSSEDRP